MSYPSGETLAYTYETATISGDSFDRTFYRPTKITSNLGFFISISYQPWNYAYTNIRLSASGLGRLYDRVTVTDPNGYNTAREGAGYPVRLRTM